MYDLEYFNEITEYINNLNNLLDNEPENEEYSDNLVNWLQEMKNLINNLENQIID